MGLGHASEGQAVHIHLYPTRLQFVVLLLCLGVVQSLRAGLWTVGRDISCPALAPSARTVFKYLYCSAVN